MELLERIVVGCLFGIPGLLLIVANYVRIFSKKIKGSPAYILGGILAAVGVLAILGDHWKEDWYYILIPIVLDWGLCLVSFIASLIKSNKNSDSEL